MTSRVNGPAKKNVAMELRVKNFRTETMKAPVGKTGSEDLTYVLLELPQDETFRLMDSSGRERFRFQVKDLNSEATSAS